MCFKTVVNAPTNVKEMMANPRQPLSNRAGPFLHLAGRNVFETFYRGFFGSKIKLHLPFPKPTETSYNNTFVHNYFVIGFTNVAPHRLGL